MKQYWQYNWWKYVAVILLPILLWTTVFNIMKQPAPRERLHILYIGDNLDAAALEKALNAFVPEHTSQKLKEITVRTEQQCDTALLTARCFEYDIILIEQPHLPKNVGEQVFPPLSAQQQALFPHIKQYEKITETEEKSYGFLLEPNDHTGFATHYSGVNTCYLFFSPESVNCDPRNGTDAALQAAKYLLENTK